MSETTGNGFSIERAKRDGWRVMVNGHEAELLNEPDDAGECAVKWRTTCPEHGKPGFGVDVYRASDLTNLPSPERETVGVERVAVYIPADQKALLENGESVNLNVYPEGHVRFGPRADTKAHRYVLPLTPDGEAGTLYCDRCGSPLQRESCNHVSPCERCMNSTDGEGEGDELAKCDECGGPIREDTDYLEDSEHGPVICQRCHHAAKTKEAHELQEMLHRIRTALNCSEGEEVEAVEDIKTELGVVDDETLRHAAERVVESRDKFMELADADESEVLKLRDENERLRTRTHPEPLRVMLMALVNAVQAYRQAEQSIGKGSSLHEQRRNELDAACGEAANVLQSIPADAAEAGGGQGEQSTREQRVNSEAPPLTAEEAEEAYNNAEPVEISEEEVERLVRIAASGHGQPVGYKRKAKALARLAKKAIAERDRLEKLLNEDNMTHAETLDRILSQQGDRCGEGWTEDYRRMREALARIAEYHDSGKHDRLVTMEPVRDCMEMWAIASDALSLTNPTPTGCGECERLKDTDSELRRVREERDAAQQQAERMREGLGDIARHYGHTGNYDAAKLMALAQCHVRKAAEALNTPPSQPGEMGEEELWEALSLLITLPIGHGPKCSNRRDTSKCSCGKWKAIAIYKRLAAARERAGKESEHAD